MKFSLRIPSVNVTKPQESADLVTFTGETFNGKLHFLCGLKFWKAKKEYVRAKYQKTDQRIYEPK